MRRALAFTNGNRASQLPNLSRLRTTSAPAAELQPEPLRIGPWRDAMTARKVSVYQVQNLHLSYFATFGPYDVNCRSPLFVSVMLHAVSRIDDAVNEINVFVYQSNTPLRYPDDGLTEIGGLKVLWMISNDMVTDVANLGFDSAGLLMKPETTCVRTTRKGIKAAVQALKEALPLPEGVPRRIVYHGKAVTGTTRQLNDRKLRLDLQKATLVFLEAMWLAFKTHCKATNEDELDDDTYPILDDIEMYESKENDNPALNNVRSAFNTLSTLIDNAFYRLPYYWKLGFRYDDIPDKDYKTFTRSLDCLTRYAKRSVLHAFYTKIQDHLHTHGLDRDIKFDNDSDTFVETCFELPKDDPCALWTPDDYSICKTDTLAFSGDLVQMVKAFEEEDAALASKTGKRPNAANTSGALFLLL